MQFHLKKSLLYCVTTAGNVYSLHRFWRLLLCFSLRGNWEHRSKMNTLLLEDPFEYVFTLKMQIVTYQKK